MTTYTWETQAYSASGPLASMDFPPQTIPVPAGSTIRRFILRNCYFMGIITGDSYNFVTPYIWTHQFVLNAESIVDRDIYTSIRAIPSQFTALYDTSTLQRIYTQIYTAADEELGVDQPTAYGKQSDTVGPSLRYQGSIFGGAGFGGVGPVTGQVAFELAVLYATPGP